MGAPAHDARLAMTTSPQNLPQPLADLHRHLDGSIRPATLVELASRAGKPIPPDLAFTAGMGLDAALARFAFTLALLQEPHVVRRIAGEMCEDAADEGVGTLEIRFAPQLHRGGAIEAVVDAALEGAAGRAGIILCGLFGEPPEMLLGLVQVAASRPGVVGIDIAGGCSPEHRAAIADYAPAFRRAEALGIGRTVHAGEGRPAAEIRDAIEALGAQRIGHGTTLLDDPSLVELVIERGVTIEACPTSNVHTGAVSAIESHPLAAWLDAGVRACVCADNTLFSATSAPEELRRVQRIEGMTEEKRRRVVAMGHAAAFRRG